VFSIFLSNHRTDLALTGTKLGCGEGGCGACTVMLSTIHDRPAWESELPGLEAVGGQAVVAAAAGPPSPPTHTPPTTTHRAVNACLMPLYSAEGTHVVTVEGLGSVADGLHPVQAALADAHGSQCGFCTPGFVMSVHALLRRRAAAAAAAGAPAALSPHDLEDALAGNLCRCTGYRPILDALNAVVGCGALAAAYAGGAATAGGGGGGCCSRGGKEGGKAACPFAGLPRASCGVRAASGGCAPAAATATTAPPPGAEPVFPPALRRRALRPLALPGLITAWHRPLTLKAVADLLADTGAMMKKDQGAPFPPTRLVVGGTEVMVEARQRGPAAVPATLIDVSHVPALAAIGPAPGGAGLAIGAAASLGRLGEALTQLREAPPGVLPGSGALAFAAAVLDQLRWFAGAQVKAVATLGGNAATASPISDLNPLWVAFGAAFDLFRADPAAPGGVSLRSVPAASFFTGYRSTALRPGEAILRLNLPWPRTGPGTRTFARSFKQARRKEDDIAIVTAGMAVVFERAAPQKSDAGGPGGSVSPRWVATHVSLAFGGVADRTVAAPAAAAALTGKDWADPASLAAGLAALGASDISIPPDAPGGMAAYRRALASGFLARFVAWAAVRLAGEEGEGRARPPPHALASLAEEWGDRPPLRGLQAWDGSDDPAAPPPTKHAAADLHVSGEATYAADVPCPAGTLHAAFITSTRAHAPLVGLDTAPALALPGVVAVVSAADVVSNAIGPACGDPVFAEGAVTHVGQPVGLVLASTEHAARAGAAAARVAYGPDSPGAVFTIEDALAAGSVFPATVDRCVRAGLGSEPASDEASLDAIFAAVAAAGGAVVAGTARIGGQEHFYLEPFGALATPVDGGRELHVLSSTQAPHHVQADIVRATGLPASRVVVKTKRLGGGFGGRETRASLVAAAAAVAAAVVRVPVRLILDRYIDMQISGQRHPFLITYRAAAHADGRLAAADVRLASNGGCSPDLSPAVMDRALLHADGCYAWPVFRARGVVARTNLPSNTAFRGFGGPQGLFGAEVMVTHLAAALGRAPEDVRAANLYSEGDPIPCGQALTECRLGAVWEEATSGRAGRGKVVEGGGGGGAPPGGGPGAPRGPGRGGGGGGGPAPPPPPPRAPPPPPPPPPQRERTGGVPPRRGGGGGPNGGGGRGRGGGASCPPPALHPGAPAGVRGRLERDPPPPQAGRRRHPHPLRHRLHLHAPQPGGRARPHLCGRRVRPRLPRRRGDGAGLTHQGGCHRGRRPGRARGHHPHLRDGHGQGRQRLPDRRVRVHRPVRRGDGGCVPDARGPPGALPGQAGRGRPHGRRGRRRLGGPGRPDRPRLPHHARPDALQRGWAVARHPLPLLRVRRGGRGRGGRLPDGRDAPDPG